MDQAIAWHLGLEEAGADRWRAFVEWLEADPAHAAAYDRLTIADAELVAPIDDGGWSVPARKTRAWPQRVVWGGSAVAAAAAAWLALVPATVPYTSLYSIEVPAGAHRDVTLADGTRIALNGATRITLDRNDPRVATLDRGEALFDVVHHADRPFELRAGGAVLRDVGTRFNVTRRPHATEVAVAEGEVLFAPDRERVSLTKGMALAAGDAAGALEVHRVAPDTVGGWRHGAVDFRDAPLASVAEDLSRSAGATIRVAAAITDQPFTGTLRVDRPVGEIATSLAALAGAAARRHGRDWMIEPTSTGER